MAGGLGGSIGTALGNVMMVAGASVEGIDSIKDMFEAVLKKEPIQAQRVDILGPQLISSLQAQVAASKWVGEDLSDAIEWAQLDQPQKQAQEKYIPSVMEEYWNIPVSHFGSQLCGPHIRLQENNPENTRWTIIKDEENDGDDLTKRQGVNAKRDKYTQEDLDKFADAVFEYGRFLKSLFIKSGLISATATDKDFIEVLGFKSQFFTKKARKIRGGSNFALESLFLNLESNIQSQISAHDWLSVKNKFQKLLALSKPPLTFKDFVQAIRNRNQVRNADLRVLSINTLKDIICEELKIENIQLTTLQDLFFGGKRIKTYYISRRKPKFNYFLNIFYHNDVLTRDILEARLRNDPLVSKGLLNIDLKLNTFLRIQERVRFELTKLIFKNDLYLNLVKESSPNFFIPEFELFLELWLCFSIEKGIPLKREDFCAEIGMRPAFVRSHEVSSLQWKNFAKLQGYFESSSGIFKPGLIHTTLSLQNQIRANEALVKYGFTRDIWERAFTVQSPAPQEPYINTNKVKNVLTKNIQGFDNLKKHIFRMNTLKGIFPIEVNNFLDYYRCSNLDAILKNLGKTLKAKVIKDVNKHFTSLEYGQVGLPNFIEDILKYSRPSPDYYSKNQLTGAGGNPDHEFVLRNIVKNVRGAIASEIPVWIFKDDNCLTGHIDLILVVGDTVYVCDYKPNLDFKDAKPSEDFVNSIPQISAYSMILKYFFGIKKVMGMIFNGDGAKIFDPINVINEMQISLGSLAIDKMSDWSLFF